MWGISIFADLDLWGISFHAVIVFGLGKNLLFKYVLGHCVLRCPNVDKKMSKNVRECPQMSEEL